MSKILPKGSYRKILHEIQRFVILDIHTNFAADFSEKHTFDKQHVQEKTGKTVNTLYKTDKILCKKARFV